ncbi:MAG: hypothetical protein ACJASI_002244 [Glaciecola sp.]|jgi:hypothetical protein
MYQLMGLGSGNNETVSSYHEFTVAASSNSGNLLFNYALEKIVTLTPEKYKWSTLSQVINDAGHNLLIPMANNIGPHTDISLAGPKVDGVKVNSVVMGIGAQFSLTDDIAQASKKVPQGTKEWLSKVAKMSKEVNISVRGKTTKAYFEEIGLGDKVEVLGCPSHLISNDLELGQTLKHKISALDEQSLYAGVAVTAGNPHQPNLAKLEKYFIGLLNQYSGSFIVQSPKSLICLAEGWLQSIEQSDIDMIQHAWFPELSYDEMIQWLRKFSRTYISIPQWFRDISKFELVVGSRIHGCQLGVQSGVPSICMYIDSRTKELCETMHLPALNAREFQSAPSTDKMFELLQGWDWDRYDENRHSLAQRTLTFLEKNGVSPSPHLYKFNR